jgi:DNA (cytosine-5)-methyltransferase 1
VITGVSLFAGIGGFDLAMQRNGVKVVATVEIDKNCNKVLAKQFPESKQFTDIQQVSGKDLLDAGFDPTNGIITGGFPCQDLSVAGKRAGLAGKRSGLFWEICRLLDETRTQTFVLENVPGLLSSNNGRDMAVVIEALVERGYSVGWRVLDAQYFGVPQRRRRVFIIGSLGGTGRTPQEILAIAEGRRGYLAKNGKESASDTTGTEISS